MTGAAVYAADYPADGITYAWVVRSPVARGTLDDVVVDPTVEPDDVLALLWHGTGGRRSTQAAVAAPW